jgi:hypothetical protein
VSKFQYISLIGGENFLEVISGFHKKKRRCAYSEGRPGVLGRPYLEQKMDAFGRPNSGGKREIIFNYFPMYINISETK